MSSAVRIPRPQPFPPSLCRTSHKERGAIIAKSVVIPAPLPSFWEMGVLELRVKLLNSRRARQVVAEAKRMRRRRPQQNRPICAERSVTEVQGFGPSRQDAQCATLPKAHFPLPGSGGALECTGIRPSSASLWKSRRNPNHPSYTKNRPLATTGSNRRAGTNAFPLRRLLAVLKLGDLQLLFPITRTDHLTR